MNFGFSPEVRPQDSPFLIMSVARNPMGKNIAWQFYKVTEEYIICIDFMIFGQRSNFLYDLFYKKKHPLDTPERKIERE